MEAKGIPAPIQVDERWIMERANSGYFGVINAFIVLVNNIIVIRRLIRKAFANPPRRHPPQRNI